MNTAVFYRQCTLQRGFIETTAWIPEEFAVKGGFVKLRKVNNWQDGWKITGVGETRLPEDKANERSRGFKHQRGASDI